MKLPFRPRLLPVALLAMGLLAAAKIERLAGQRAPRGEAQASTPAPPPRPAMTATGPATVPGPQAPAAAQPLSAEEVAERAVLESLRARRLDIERRAEEVAQRELLLGATERRLSERLDELRALQARLQGELRIRSEREEAGIRQLVRVYELMRPRDAATILDDLDMPILLQVLDRMREAKAAPVLAAMRPERARAATTELSRLRTAIPNP